MSVEPRIVDTNVLVYALDADAPQHAAARALIDAARTDAPATLFVTSQILCEFYSIVTNPRRVPEPRTAAELWPRFPAYSLFSTSCLSRHMRLTGC